MKGRKVLASVSLSVGLAADVLLEAAEKNRDNELKLLARDLRRWVHRARRSAGIDVKPVLTGRARRLNDPER